MGTHDNNDVDSHDAQERLIEIVNVLLFIFPPLLLFSFFECAYFNIAGHLSSRYFYNYNFM